MSLSGKITRRLQRWPKERVFSRFDFLDLGSTDAVGMVLKRLHDAGAIRRVKRGYYDRPRETKVFGRSYPSPVSPGEFVAAVARRTGQSLQPHEAQAANELRLSEQVPAQIAYETNGPTREIDLGKGRPVRLQRRATRAIAQGAEVSRFVFAGLRALGRAHVTRESIAHLREELKPEHRRQLLRDLRYAPAWMHPHLRYIAGEDETP